MRKVACVLFLVALCLEPSLVGAASAAKYASTARALTPRPDLSSESTENVMVAIVQTFVSQNDPASFEHHKVLIDQLAHSLASAALKAIPELNLGQPVLVEVHKVLASESVQELSANAWGFLASIATLLDKFGGSQSALRQNPLVRSALDAEFLLGLEADSCPADSVGALCQGSSARHVCDAGKYLNCSITDDLRVSGECITCPAGYFDHGHRPGAATTCSECQPCPDGEVAATGQTGCTACTAGKTASDALDHCVCSPGHTGDDCTPCAAGTYKLTLGAIECSNCSAGSFSAGGAANCTICPVNTNSTEGSSSCECALGFTLVNGECKACDKGSYKSTLGPDQCTPCPQNSSTVSTGADSIADCHECVPGFTFNDQTGLCEECPLNTYKSDAGRHICTPCPDNSVSEKASTSVSDCGCGIGFYGTLAASSDTCTNCPAGFYTSSPGQSKCDECGFNAEYSSIFNACVCSGGFHPVGNDCDPCPAGQFKAAGNHTCSSCPGNSTSPRNASDVSDCVCLAGYAFADNACSECPASHYKSDAGNVPCSLCSGCPTNAATSINHTCGGALDTVCVCQAGHAPSTPATTFGAASGVTCDLCDAGTYAPQGSSICKPCAGSCPTNAVPTNVCGGGTNLRCQCAAGTRQSSQARTSPWDASIGVTCSKCEKGEYQDDAGQTTCKSCPQNYYSDETGAEICKACPENSSGPGESTSVSGCICASGFVRSNNLCVRESGNGDSGDAGDTSSGGGLSGGAIAGIVVGVVVVLGLISVAVVVRKNSGDDSAPEERYRPNSNPGVSGIGELPPVSRRSVVNQAVPNSQVASPEDVRFELS